MTDIAFISRTGALALTLETGHLALDESLRPAVLISLLTDAEVPALSEGERRGWWGDALVELPSDRIGSRLWVLRREKITTDLPARVRAICEEALAWLRADGLAKAVTVTATRAGLDRIDAAITVTRPDGQRELVRFALVWSATLNDMAFELENTP